MNKKEVLIKSFYEAFKQKDYKSMQESYADNATFTDPVFLKLNASQVRSMWEMFCVTGKDLNVEFSIVRSDKFSVKAKWKATYTFSATGRKVVNNIQSRFNINDGKIVEHYDHFNFYAWAKQALGISGLLLGWTPYVKNKVRKTALRNLKKHMSHQK